VRAAVIVADGDRVTLPSAHTALDMGGIGVGYGLDRAGAVLRARGITRAFIDVSGDCLAIGAPPGRDGWPVEIAHPDGGTRRLGHVLLRDRALATSANTQSVVRWDGRDVGHVLDPDTGEPARGCRQATAVCRTGVEADALSTAMLVTGRRYAAVLQSVVA
jgi:thiamine biosynthesis lipoprotein